MDQVANKRRGLRFTSHICREGSRLLHAQCWAWGRDIIRTEGNLLLLHGFERLRPPDKVAGCSQYSLSIERSLTIRLWGFGVYIGQAEGIYLSRYGFLPRRALLTDAWRPDPLARGKRCFDLPLMAAFTEWACHYEMWVEQRLGRDYRRSIFLGWNENTAEPLDLAVEWLRLRETIDREVLDPTP